jgi:hypothetical protein
MDYRKPLLFAQFLSLKNPANSKRAVSKFKTLRAKNGFKGSKDTRNKPQRKPFLFMFVGTM